MVWKAIKHTTQIVSAVLAGLALLILVVAWKLSQGPISLPQLTPYIVEAVSHNTRGMTVKIEDTVLSWEGWERTLDIKIVKTSIFSRDGRRVASVPEASLSLSVPALITGVIAPSSLELIEPEINLMRHGDGTFAFELGGGMTVRAGRAFQLDDVIGKTPDPSRPLSYLQKLAITKATLVYNDRQNDIKLVAPDTSFMLERIGETMVLDTKIDVSLANKPAQLELNAAYNLTTEILDAQVNVISLNVGDLATLLPELVFLKPLQFNLEGKSNLVVDKDGTIRSFFTDLKSTEGFLNIPSPARQTLAIDAMSLRAAYEDLDGKIRIDEAMLALPVGSLIKTPKPVADYIPMEVVRFSGEYDTVKDLFRLDRLHFDMGEGPTGSLTGTVEGLLQAESKKVDVIGELLNVNPSNLYRYWPRGLNDDARDWVVNNISEGMVHRAGIDLSLSAKENGEIELHHVHGDMEMDGVSVDYLNPMPKVKNAKGWAKFDHQTFKITATGGQVADIKLEKAQIDILGLDEYDQRLNLSLTAKGPLRDTLHFIDNEPLGFAKALDISPDKTSGDAVTDLTMSFLLLDDLSWDGVDVQAKAKGTNITIQDVMFDEDISKGEIELVVDKKGMDVQGNIILGSIPADLKWRENFTDNTLFKRRFLLDGIVDADQRVNELRLDFPPFNDKTIDGPLHVDATITEDWGGVGILEVFANLEGADIDIPIIHWRKEAEGEGEAYAKVNFNKDRLIGVPYFSISSGDLKASGSIALDQKGKQIQTMKISRFQAGKTNITNGTILYSPQMGWELDITGESLDLTQLLKKSRATGQTASIVSDEEKDTELPGTFSGRFARVWLDEDYSLNTVAGALSSDGKVWTQAHLSGEVGGGGKPFVIDLSPFEGNRRLKMETANAGALLRALDLFDDMQGGNLTIEGTINDDVPRRPLVGSIRVNNYRITKVPALAKLLSLAALTGVVDSLQGDGIGFSSLISPFKYDGGVIEFKDGRTNGISLGLTWEGKVYTYANVADITGTVVPAYGLNSLLGNVPILGTLFSAGEKGGGLFAWTYTVKGDLDDADVSVNPVSALAPGVLRKLFQIGDEETPAPAK